MDDSTAVALLEGLLDAPLPSVPTYLARELERRGFRVSRDDGSVIGELGPREALPIVIAGTAEAKTPLAALVAAASANSTTRVIVVAAADEEALAHTRPPAVLVGRPTGWCKVAVEVETDRDDAVVRALTSAIRRHGGRPRLERAAVARNPRPLQLAAYGPENSETYLQAVAVLADALSSLPELVTDRAARVNTAEARTRAEDAVVTDRLRSLGYID